MAVSQGDYGDGMMEDREDLMLQSMSTAPKASTPTHRLAHFLKPYFQTPQSRFPSFSLFSSSTPLKISFHGWRTPHNDWNTWLHRMHFLHKSTWLKSGIHDALINSTFTIYKIEPLILGLAERWCCETNTFVFPFGEATITLEDVMILGGFPVLGDFVVDCTDDDEVSQKLEEARLELVRTSAHTASQYQWMAKFSGSGSKIEHAAFLVLWLSRFVFPSTSQPMINKNVIPIASRLSQGCKIALAPAVLAAIYSDLSSLKNAIVHGESSISVLAVFQLVQVWIWERFPTIRPNPNLVDGCKPRFGLWHNCVSSKAKDIERTRLALESGSDWFQWRPYYKDMNTITKEGWILYDSNRDDLVEYTRICRDSKLAGLNCIEQYLPHRAARQFGFDQDVPSNIPQSKKAPKDAWKNYTRPVSDKKLHFPSKCFEAGVTMRYFKWWNAKIGCKSTSVKRRGKYEGDKQTGAEFIRKKRSRIGKKLKMAEPLRSSLQSPPDIEFALNKVKMGHTVEDSEKKEFENGGWGIHGNEEGSVVLNLIARVIKLEEEVVSMIADLGY